MTIDLRSDDQIKHAIKVAVDRRRDIIGRGTWSTIQNEELLETLNTAVNDGLDELRNRGEAGPANRKEVTA